MAILTSWEDSVDSFTSCQTLNDDFHTLWMYSTSVFRWPRNADPVYMGSATFVLAGGQRCLLTAEHVWEGLRYSDRVTLNLQGKGPSVTIETQMLSCRYASERLVSEWGPDLALLELPIIEANTIERSKVFYSLDRRKSEALASSPLYNAGEWALIGAPGEFCSVEEKRAKLDVCLLVSNLRAKHEHGGFDYVDISLDTKGEPELPNSYGGLSGSGLWQLQGGSASLEGVAFYQSIEASKQYVRCHARKSIYLHVLGGIA